MTEIEKQIILPFIFYTNKKKERDNLINKCRRPNHSSISFLRKHRKKERKKERI